VSTRPDRAARRRRLKADRKAHRKAAKGRQCQHRYRPPEGEAWSEPWPGDDNMPSDSAEVRRRWPRRYCEKCSAICYESFAHYIAGDW